MRPGSLFLNLSRGFVVDHAALRRHIESGHLAGAAVDVFPHEPKGRGEEFVSELRGLPNVILTPHIGGSTEEAQQDIGQFVAGKLRDFWQFGNTTMSVNLPTLVLPQRPEAHRITHLHHNVPGVLATINGILAEQQGQHRGPAARHPRRARVRHHRRLRRLPARRCSTSCAAMDETVRRQAAVVTSRTRCAAAVGDAHVLTDRSVTASYETDWTGRFSGRARCVVRPADTDAGRRGRAGVRRGRASPCACRAATPGWSGRACPPMVRGAVDSAG